jgi:hypothetical protein
MLAGERRECPLNSSRCSPKSPPSISRRIKKVPPLLPSPTYWSADKMLPSCMEMNEEIAAMRPFLSGQEMSSLRL